MVPRIGWDGKRMMESNGMEWDGIERTEMPNRLVRRPAVALTVVRFKQGEVGCCRRKEGWMDEGVWGAGGRRTAAAKKRKGKGK